LNPASGSGSGIGEANGDGGMYKKCRHKGEVVHSYQNFFPGEKRFEAITLFPDPPKQKEIYFFLYSEIYNFDDVRTKSKSI